MLGMFKSFKPFKMFNLTENDLNGLNSLNVLNGLIRSRRAGKPAVDDDDLSGHEAVMQNKA